MSISNSGNTSWVILVVMNRPPSSNTSITRLGPTRCSTSQLTQSGRSPPEPVGNLLVMGPLPRRLGSRWRLRSGALLGSQGHALGHGLDVAGDHPVARLQARAHHDPFGIAVGHLDLLHRQLVVGRHQPDSVIFP